MRVDFIVTPPVQISQFTKLNLTPSSDDSEVAIACAILLDEQLYDLLMASLGGSRRQRKLLLNEPGPRKGWAHCLGLIGRLGFTDLALIASARNRFAHDLRRPSFDENPVRSYVATLSNYPLGAAQGLSNRAIFVEAVERLSLHLSECLEEV